MGPHAWALLNTVALVLAASLVGRLGTSLMEVFIELLAPVGPPRGGTLESILLAGCVPVPCPSWWLVA